MEKIIFPLCASDCQVGIILVTNCQVENCGKELNTHFTRERTQMVKKKGKK